MSKIQRVINTPELLDSLYSSYVSPNSSGGGSTSPPNSSLNQMQIDALNNATQGNALNNVTQGSPPSSTPSKFSTSKNKSDGTIGTKGLNNSPYAPNALSLQTIDNLTSQAMKTAIDPNDFLRERVVKIALSYVGINELKNEKVIDGKVDKTGNHGWYDERFTAKMKGLTKKWYKTPFRGNTGAWCNYFTNLVWQEAYYKGNALVGANTDPVSVNTYNTVLNKIGGSKKTKTRFYFSGSTKTTRTSFKRAFNGKYFISKEEAVKGFKPEKIPQPGDLVLYDGHIAILFKVNIKDNKLVSYSSIDGNSSAADERDGGKCMIKKNINVANKENLMGFGMLQRKYTE